MSAPTSDFSKLSINPEMQTMGPKKGAVRPDPTDDPSSSDGESKISHEKGIFAVDHCRQINAEDSGRCFAFQIVYAEIKHVGIRINERDPKSPSCSCDEPVPCRHISWLLDQLSHVEDVAASPFEAISNVALDRLCDELHWELREGFNSSETRWKLQKSYIESVVGRQTRGVMRGRAQAVRELLATLSPVITEDYRADIFDFAEDIPLEHVFVHGDLEATMSRLLIVDDGLFYFFKSIVTRNDCAADYFRKMSAKAENVCCLLDEYIHNGPAAGTYDLSWCAQTLMSIVDSISANVRDPGRAPLSRATKEEAARALVSILAAVVDRNNDAYSSITWNRRRPHGERENSRNLYKCIVGSASRPGSGNANFVIKALNDVADVGERFVEDLNAILAKVETVGWDTPRPFLDNLRVLIARIKKVIGGPGGSNVSSGKRRAASMERTVKRTK